MTWFAGMRIYQGDGIYVDRRTAAFIRVMYELTLGIDIVTLGLANSSERYTTKPPSEPLGAARSHPESQEVPD